MRLPSIKTLSIIAGDRAKELRGVLEICRREDLENRLGLTTGDFGSNGVTKYPVTAAWYRSCSSPPLCFGDAKLSIADEILGTHGIEHIPSGRGKRSPAITYCNAGDSYALTLMYVSGGGYRVGSWSDIVEGGEYD